MMMVMMMIQIYKLNRNVLKIPAGGRLNSWLFTKRGGFESGTTRQKNWHLVAGPDLKPSPQDYKIPRPNL